MPNKRVYLIIIFLIFPPPCIWTCHILFPTLLVYLALLILLFHPTPLFGPIFYEIYIEYPPYSFIWPYSFNWHLRVLFPYHSSLQSWQKYNTAVGTQFSITFEVYWLLRTLEVFFKILEEADMVMVWISNLVVFYYSRLLQSERLQPKSSRNENGWL